MPRAVAPIIVEAENAPDPVAAADGILPLFLAFIEGRGRRPTVPKVAPARVQDETHTRN